MTVDDRSSRGRMVLAVVMSGWMSFGIGCATTDPVTGRRVSNAYSIDEDIRLGRAFHRETVAELKGKGIPINRDSRAVALVDGVLGHIAEVSHLPDLPYASTFAGDPSIVNAYAFPGGRIMVFEGLWNRKHGLVRTVDELAAVIGHEIAHVTCRHTTEAMTREILPELLLAGGMVWASIEEDESLQALFGGLLLVHDGLIVTRYSRRDELEADRIGMMYMAKAGYDPAAAVRVWERVAGEGEGRLDSVLSIFSTHPRDRLRVEELKRHLPEAMALFRAAPIRRDGSTLLPIRAGGGRTRTARDRGARAGQH